VTGNSEKRVIILDTSAFVAGFDPFSSKEELFTVAAVKKEILEDSTAWVRFDTAAHTGRLKVRIPEEDFVCTVKKSATLVGDSFFLSNVDQQVLALALQLKTQGFSPLIATDDYSIQNVADQMDVEFASLATFGIRFRLQWKRYCPACHKRYPVNYGSNRCSVCDTELKRKPLKRKLLDR